MMEGDPLGILKSFLEWDKGVRQKGKEDLKQLKKERQENQGKSKEEFQQIRDDLKQSVSEANQKFKDGLAKDKEERGDKSVWQNAKDEANQEYYKEKARQDAKIAQKKAMKPTDNLVNFLVWGIPILLFSGVLLMVVVLWFGDLLGF